MMIIEFVGGPMDGEIQAFQQDHDFMNVSPGEEEFIIGTYQPRELRGNVDHSIPILFDWIPAR